MAGALPLHYRRGKMVQLIGKPDPKTIHARLIWETGKNHTQQLMAHHLCRKQEPPDLGTEAMPCIQQRRTPQTPTNSLQWQHTEVHPRNRSGQALA